jgi:hypothetical protein
MNLKMCEFENLEMSDRYIRSLGDKSYRFSKPGKFGELKMAGTSDFGSRASGFRFAQHRTSVIPFSIFKNF